MPSLTRAVSPRPAFTHAARLHGIALGLLAFAVVSFADHIASYYLLQWAPTLKRYPTQEERAAVARALAMDLSLHGVMWLALAGSFAAWRRGIARREARPDAGSAVRWMALGVGVYAVLRVVVESHLAIGLVRVPSVTLGIDWHGTSFALGGMAILLAALLAARARTIASAPSTATRHGPSA
jgi:uncharacterized membrane protein